MTLLTWNHACSVGVRAMDDQHGILMDAINELRMAIVRGADRDETGALLNQVIDFTRMHFASEEQLMQQHAFPGLAEHQIEHRQMMGHLAESAIWVQHGDVVPMRILLGRLREEYFEHIEGLDQRYGGWLNEHGVS